MVLTGRGGYGNYIRRKEGEALAPVPSTPAPIQHFTSPQQTFRAGRGGYGNNVPISRMPTMTPQEYLQEVHRALDVEPERYTVGRGGAGNFVSKQARQELEKRKAELVKNNPRLNNGKTLTPINSMPLSPVSSMPQTDLHPTRSEGLWSRLKTTLSN
jgi:hypothetical protein